MAFPLHPLGNVPQTKNGEDREQIVIVFYQFPINKPSHWGRGWACLGFNLLWGLEQFYTSTLQQFHLFLLHQDLPGLFKCNRATSASLSHSSEKWNPESLSVAVERCSSAMGVTWRTKNRLDEYSLFKEGLRSKWWFEDVNYEGEWHNPIPFKECLLKLPPYFHTHTFSLPLNVKELGKRPHAQKLHMDTYPFFHVFVSSGICREKMAYRTNYLQRHILLL